MTTDPAFRALVVDDDPQMCDLATRALSDEGFACDMAADGLEARSAMDKGAYDVVVTDLRMPNGNGHALAVRLLMSEHRPAVVILTGVLEPKLAKDLIRRGVDMVEFKPVQLDLFAAKVKSLVCRRRQEPNKESTLGQPVNDRLGGKCQDTNGSEEIVGGRAFPADMDRRLADLSGIPSLSHAAFDVIHMANSNVGDTLQLAAAISQDAALSAQVLRLANSSFYNASGTRIAELEHAVVRLGRKRISELAIAVTMMRTLTRHMLPWMNINLVWRRSIAAGTAVDSLLARGEYAGIEESLFLSAILYPMGRVALGMLYPEHYQEMVHASQERQQSLLEQERNVFGMSHSEAMSRLLEVWNIPLAVYQPLRYITEAYHALAKLPEPLRAKVEFLKLAVLIGEIAVGEWEPWDHLELPPPLTQDRLAAGSFSAVIEEVRVDTERIADFCSQLPWPVSEERYRRKRNLPVRRLPYCRLVQDRFDFLGELISSRGIELITSELATTPEQEIMLVNAIGSLPDKLATSITPRRMDRTLLIVTDAPQPEVFGRFGRVLPLPASYGALCLACESITHAAAIDLPLPAELIRGTSPQTPRLEAGSFDRSI